MADSRKGVVITIANQKGGVGKTTNTVHLAAAMAERRHRCLIIDLDPAAGSTKHCGVNPLQYAGTFELLTRPEPDPVKLAVHGETMPKGVELIPSRIELSELPGTYISKFIDEKKCLARGLDMARANWDVIFLDTPPNPASLLTLNAYNLSEWILISTFPHALSIHGMNDALADIADVRTNVNPELEVLGVLVSNVDGRTKAWREVEDVIAENFPGRHFSSHVSQAQAVAEASGKGKTIFQLRKYKGHKVAEQYRGIAAEIEWRIQNREDFLNGGQQKLEMEPREPSPANDDNRASQAANG